jgi:hypothetical protein
VTTDAQTDSLTHLLTDGPAGSVAHGPDLTRVIDGNRVPPFLPEMTGGGAKGAPGGVPCIGVQKQKRMYG